MQRDPSIVEYFSLNIEPMASFRADDERQRNAVDSEYLRLIVSRLRKNLILHVHRRKNADIACTDSVD